MDDGTIDLSIMHKVVREMTGSPLVGSPQKQAINSQGNNNDSSQGNKGHPLLPIVINLAHSSIGRKMLPPLTTQESYTVGTSSIRLDMQSSLYRGKKTFSVLCFTIFAHKVCRGWGKGTVSVSMLKNITRI